jgi:hypothetical protein
MPECNTSVCWNRTKQEWKEFLLLARNHCSDIRLRGCLRRLRAMVIYDEPGTPLARQVCPDPLQEDAHTQARLRQELEMDRRPCEPCHEAAYADLAALQDGEALTDYRHTAFVKVTEWSGHGFAADTAVNQFPCVSPLLDRHLRNSGQRLSVLIE